VTHLPPSQPMTRRERRLLEEQSLTPSTELAPPPAAPNLEAAPVSPPEPAVVSPPPAPLSRRELRDRERSSEPAPPVVWTEPIPEVVEAFAPVPTPVVSLPPVVLEPLPPVFGSSPVTQETPRQSVAGETHVAPATSQGDTFSATSSLILPSTPMVDMTSPLTSTGEVVVTGQIVLPPRISESGTNPRLDHASDQDEVMDAYVTGEMAAMSKPMRASQAVSGKGDDTDILLVRSARWGKAAVVTAISAASLGLIAVGLLVLAMMTDVIA
jgi:hypothetical protein